MSCISSVISSENAIISNQFGVASTFPASNFSKDRKSFKMVVRLLIEFLIFEVCFSTLDASCLATYLSISEADSCIELSGVRNSWDAMETNRVLSWLSSRSFWKSALMCSFAVSSSFIDRISSWVLSFTLVSSSSV